MQSYTTLSLDCLCGGECDRIRNGAERSGTKKAADIQPQWISGSAIGAVPSRKSKSQPRSACVTCCAYSRPKPRGYWGSRGVHAARRRASSSSATRSERRRSGHVQLDDVAVPHERQRAADERLRRDVQHARRRSSCRSSARPRRAPCRGRPAPAASSESAACPTPACPGPPSGPGVLQHEHRVGRHRQRRIVDPRLQVVVVAEHDRRSGMLQQPAVRGGVLDDGAVRRQVAAQHRDAPFGSERPIARRRSPRRCETTASSRFSPERPAVDGRGSPCAADRAADCSSPRSPPA